MPVRPSTRARRAIRSRSPRWARCSTGSAGCPEIRHEKVEEIRQPDRRRGLRDPREARAGPRPAARRAPGLVTAPTDRGARPTTGRPADRPDDPRPGSPASAGLPAFRGSPSDKRRSAWQIFLAWRRWIAEQSRSSAICRRLDPFTDAIESLTRCAWAPRSVPTAGTRGRTAEEISDVDPTTASLAPRRADRSTATRRHLGVAASTELAPCRRPTRAWSRC